MRVPGHSHTNASYWIYQNKLIYRTIAHFFKKLMSPCHAPCVSDSSRLCHAGKQETFEQAKNAFIYRYLISTIKQYGINGIYGRCMLVQQQQDCSVATCRVILSFPPQPSPLSHKLLSHRPALHRMPQFITFQIPLSAYHVSLTL